MSNPYVPESHPAGPTMSHEAPTKRSKRKVVALAAVPLTVFGLVAGGVFAAVYLDGRADRSPDPETEIRAAIDTFYSAGNGGDLARLKSAMCASLADELLADLTKEEFAALASDGVEADGWFVVDWFDQVKVIGAHADAKIAGHSSGGQGPNIGDERQTIGLSLVDGSWKVCEAPADDAVTERKRTEAAETASVQQLIVEYIAARNSADLTGMRRMACGAAADELAALSAETFATIVAENPWSLRSFDDTVVNGQSAKVTVTTDVSDGSVVFAMLLQRVEEQWRVCAAEPVAGYEGTAR